MPPWVKIMLGLCAAVAVGQLILAVDDPSRAGAWLGVVSMVLVGVSIVMQDRHRRRGGGDGR